MFSGCSILVESTQGLEAAGRDWAILNFSGSVVFAAICILIILKRCRVVVRAAAVIRSDMFRSFKKLNNESGIVLFIVLMTVIIIMIVSATILSQSMNEINFAQQQIDEIATDQLTKGIFWNEYSSGMLSVAPTGTILQGRTYNIVLNPLGTVAGVSSYNVIVNYDSFQ